MLWLDVAGGLEGRAGHALVGGRPLKRRRMCHVEIAAANAVHGWRGSSLLLLMLLLLLVLLLLLLLLKRRWLHSWCDYLTAATAAVYRLLCPLVLVVACDVSLVLRNNHKHVYTLI